MRTTTMTVPAPAHGVAVVSDGFDYLAECSCGWASDWHATPGGRGHGGRRAHRRGDRAA